MRKLIQFWSWAALRKLVFTKVVLPAQRFKKDVCPHLIANCSCGNGRVCLQSQSFVVDHDGELFISGPAVVEILYGKSAV